MQRGAACAALSKTEETKTNNLMPFLFAVQTKPGTTRRRGEREARETRSTGAAAAGRKAGRKAGSSGRCNKSATAAQKPGNKSPKVKVNTDGKRQTFRARETEREKEWERGRKAACGSLRGSVECAGSMCSAESTRQLKVATTAAAAAAPEAAASTTG